MIGNSSFKVGIYIRLSRDDGNVESDSIVSQRSLLNQYIKENNYNLIDEYVDDGFTGINFERPSFKRMIKDIESGKINMIITKDMSRLGRDYIGTGELIEKYFPNKNVRYIAINDGIDTFIDNTNNDIAPFKSILNEMYAKDTSKKINSVLQSKRNLGEYLGTAPYGYKKDPENKYNPNAVGVYRINGSLLGYVADKDLQQFYEFKGDGYDKMVFSGNIKSVIRFGKEFFVGNIAIIRSEDEDELTELVNKNLFEDFNLYGKTEVK